MSYKMLAFITILLMRASWGCRGRRGSHERSLSEFQIRSLYILRSKPCPSQYLTHLYVVCHHFICNMSLFQDHVSCQNFTLTGPLQFLYPHLSSAATKNCLEPSNKSISTATPPARPWGILHINKQRVRGKIITNTELCGNLSRISDLIRMRRLKFAGHCYRANPNNVYHTGQTAT